MNALSDFIREKTLFWVLVLGSLTAGLVAAYGRERHQGRFPPRSWWEIRLYAMPFLGILTAAIVDQFTLNTTKTAFVAAMLAMLGYELIGVLHDRGLERVKKISDTIGGGDDTPAARPFYSVVDTDGDGLPTAHVVVTPPPAPVGGDVGGVAGAVLRRVHPAPDDDTMKPLLDALDDDMGDVPGIG